MPIDYADYPKNWRTEIRPAILHRAENRCERCLRPNWTNPVALTYGLGGRRHTVLSGYDLLNNFIWHDADVGCWRDEFGDIIAVAPALVGTVKRVRIVLTIAHWDQNKQNNNPANLRALCQRCHLNHDRAHHLEVRRRKRDERRGQYNLI